MQAGIRFAQMPHKSPYRMPMWWQLLVHWGGEKDQKAACKHRVQILCIILFLVWEVRWIRDFWGQKQGVRGNREWGKVSSTVASYRFQVGISSPKAILVPRASYKCPHCSYVLGLLGIPRGIHLSSRPLSATPATAAKVHMGFWLLQMGSFIISLRWNREGTPRILWSECVYIQVLDENSKEVTVPAVLRGSW